MPYVAHRLQIRLSFTLIAAILLCGERGNAQPARLQTTRADSARRVADTIKVTGRIDELIGTAKSASEGRVGAVDLRARPLTREGELLETVPGLIVTQHSGDGKANQYFVRGFNLDHGTDFRTMLEGMPLNMPTHGHGQGYTDLNIVIPELVDHLDYKLGVSHAEYGDFGSAGGAQFHLMKKLARPFATLETGANGLARLAAGASTRVGAGTLLVGGEAKAYDGPWTRSQDIRKFGGMARYTVSRGGTELSVLGLAYRNRWNATDQIAKRAVNGGVVSRFGQLDSTDGGNAQRYSVSASLRHVGQHSVQTVQLYGISSDLKLFSNFSYFLADPVNGDQFAQWDRRTIVGGSATHAQSAAWRGVNHMFTIGLQSRSDFINGLGLSLTKARQTLATIREDRIRQTSTGVYVEAESRWHPKFRSVVGLRGDVHRFNVTSDNALNSGSRAAAIASPKLSLVLTPTATSELYASGGFGFHSNDARGTTIRVDPVSGEAANRVDPLVRSRGGEFGLRLSLVQNLRSTVSLWALNLDSELLFVGDAGGTEPSAGSQRSGVTFANFYRLTPRISLDADVSFAHARFAADNPAARNIPGALENVIAGGITRLPANNGVLGAIRLRHFGAYPLLEDNSVRARASSLVNADAGYVFAGGLRVQVSMLNVFNSKADDIQYYYASRLKGEPAEGVDDVHFHPAEPRQLRFSVGWKF
ncbi:MAG: TonB-dependent receptor [Phycisphaerae bacterium]|nr:TonB-dependent receptor [Gemmatimonadaceae bacterium]